MNILFSFFLFSAIEEDKIRNVHIWHTTYRTVTLFFRIYGLDLVCFESMPEAALVSSFSVKLPLAAFSCLQLPASCGF